MAFESEMTELQLERHRRDQREIRAQLSRMRQRELRDCLDRWVQWAREAPARRRTYSIMRDSSRR